MATSFAQGLAEGLMNRELLDLRRGADRRAEAISLAQLASQAEDLEYRRQQRKKDEDFRVGMSNLYGNIYNPEVEEKVEVKTGAMTDPSAPKQFTTQKVRKNFNMGERSEEGRARDLQYMMGYTKLLIDNGKITPDQMKQSMEFTRYLESEGLKDSLASLMLNPNDTKAAGVLAKRFNLSPESVNFEVVTKDANNQQLVVPRYVLNAKNANGMPVQYDVSNALQAIGVSTLTDIQKNAGDIASKESGVLRDRAAISASNAQVSESGARTSKLNEEIKNMPAESAATINEKNATAALRRAQAGAVGDKSDLVRQRVGTEYDIFNKNAQSTLGNKGPVLPWQMEVPGKGFENIDDVRGGEIIGQIGGRMLDAGVKGGEAWRRTQEIVSKLNAAAMTDLDDYYKRLKANPEQFGTTKEQVARSMADPNFKIQGFNTYRSRRLEKLLKQMQQ